MNIELKLKKILEEILALKMMLLYEEALLMQRLIKTDFKEKISNEC
jgi:hypothetical protein